MLHNNVSDDIDLFSILRNRDFLLTFEMMSLRDKIKLIAQAEEQQVFYDEYDNPASEYDEAIIYTNIDRSYHSILFGIMKISKAWAIYNKNTASPYILPPFIKEDMDKEAFLPGNNSGIADEYGSTYVFLKKKDARQVIEKLQIPNAIAVMIDQPADYISAMLSGGGFDFVQIFPDSNCCLWVVEDDIFLEDNIELEHLIMEYSQYQSCDKMPENLIVRNPSYVYQRIAELIMSTLLFVPVFITYQDNEPKPGFASTPIVDYSGNSIGKEGLVIVTNMKLISNMSNGDPSSKTGLIPMTYSEIETLCSNMGLIPLINPGSSNFIIDEKMKEKINEIKLTAEINRLVSEQSNEEDDDDDDYDNAEYI